MNVHEIIAEKKTICKKSQAQQYTLWPCEETDIDTAHLMLIGETGKGKTTLINGILNFVLGINCHYVYRFCVPVNITRHNKRDIDSQTDKITLYKIPHVEGIRNDKNLVLIDTPGLLDTEGIECQKQSLDQINSFLANPTYKENMFIGIVAEANLTLNNNVRNLINLIEKIVQGLSNVKVILIATFADAFEPKMFSLIKEYLKVKLEGQFKINNKILFSNFNVDDESEWRTWEKNMALLLQEIQIFNKAPDSECSRARRDSVTSVSSSSTYLTTKSNMSHVKRQEKDMAEVFSK
ncbi:unnamed protein product, partial [Meganyctiphanes norvegica]